MVLRLILKRKVNRIKSFDPHAQPPTRNFWKIEKIVTNEIMIQRKMGKDQQGY